MQDTGLTLNEAWNPREADLYASTLQLPISMRGPDNPLPHPIPASPAHLLFRPPTHPPVRCAARAATTRCARGAPFGPGPGQTFGTLWPQAVWPLPLPVDCNVDSEFILDYDWLRDKTTPSSSPRPGLPRPHGAKFLECSVRYSKLMIVHNINFNTSQQTTNCSNTR